MDWRIKQKSVVFGVAIGLTEERDLDIDQIGIPKTCFTLKDLETRQLDYDEGKAPTFTEWIRPTWDERVRLEKSLEKAVIAPDGVNVVMAYSPSDLRQAFVSVFLKDWTFSDSSGKKLEKESLLDLHPLVIESHIQLFMKDLVKYGVIS